MPADGPRRPSRLAQHDSALSSLLESLLAEVPEYRSEDPVTVVPMPLPDSRIDAEAASPPSLKPAPTGPLQEPSAVDDPVPSWAKQSFRVLLFHIGSLRFAMPLVQMRGVSLMPDKKTRLPGRASWHLGMIRVRNASVALVELGALLGIDAACEQPGYLLLIADGSAAIACDRIGEAVTIEPDRVRWRRCAGQRIWLAGMLSDEMCLLLDAEALGEMIRHG
jgi:purine-binding chemotaxis protein CheW